MSLYSQGRIICEIHLIQQTICPRLAILLMTDMHKRSQMHSKAMDRHRYLTRISDRPKGPSDLVLKMACYVGLLAIVLTCLAFSAQYSNNLTLFILFAVTIAISILCEKDNILQFMIVSGHYAFWVFPVTAVIFTEYPINSYPLTLCILALVLMMIFSSGQKVETSQRDKFLKMISLGPKLFLAIISALSLILVFTSGASFLYSIGLVTASSYIFSSNKGAFYKVASLTGAGAYILLYTQLYWSGFGRLTIFSPLLVLFVVNFGRYFNGLFFKMAIFLGVAFGSLAGSMIRSGATTLSDAFKVSLNDSNVGPVLMLMRIHETHGLSHMDFKGWFDQIILFFAIGFPRAWWPDKPQGFGFRYTLDMLEPYLRAAGHSIAPTMVGEHIYYLGPVGAIFGITVSAVLIVTVYRVLSSDSVFGSYGALVVAMWLPTFYWGGLASFSARFSLSVAALILLLVAYRVSVRFRRSHRRHHELMVQ